MRMINADVLDKELGVSDCDISMRELVNEQPTIDAIQVGQVAKMLRLLTDSTCPVEFMGIDKNAWCDENCDSYEKDCWLHAIKEGWLDDEN